MMHLLSASCVQGALIIAVICQVNSLETIIGQYGETLEVPCNNGAANPTGLLITKWKYDKGEGVSGDLIVKPQDQNASVIATDNYKSRVSLAENSSLLISEVTLSDQKTFTCMLVSGVMLDIKEYPVSVQIHKAPSRLEIADKAEELEIGKLVKLGQCRAEDAYPAVNITWFKNKRPLEADGKGILITASVHVDPDTGLSTTSSTLQYTAEKADTDAQFTCVTQLSVGTEKVSAPVTFTITYPTEHISLQVSEGAVTEGDNVTLKCMADGNPAPTSFNFHIKGEVVKVEDSNTYTLTGVTRDATGEYKCSLTDDDKIEASKNITVNYLDMNLSPSGMILKKAGEALAVSLHIDASEVATVSWTKDNIKLDGEPNFEGVTYSDSGRYECEVTIGAISQKGSFELIVEGGAVIRQLYKRRGEDGQHKVLYCEAEGSPKPVVTWSINGTSADETPFINGKITHSLSVVPTANLTVYCSVYNVHGQDSKDIKVSSLFVEEVKLDKQDQPDDSDQTKLVVGVIVGLLVATGIVGLAYWVYMKRSKQGTWKTNEKEDGSSEEEKKLEEKVEENSQKAEEV